MSGVRWSIHSTIGLYSKHYNIQVRNQQALKMGSQNSPVRYHTRPESRDLPCLRSHGFRAHRSKSSRLHFMGGSMIRLLLVLYAANFGLATFSILTPEMYVSVEACNTGVPLRAPWSALAEPECNNSAPSLFITQSDSPQTNTAVRPLWRFAHTITGGFPSVTGFIVRIGVGDILASGGRTLPTSTPADGFPRGLVGRIPNSGDALRGVNIFAPRAVGVCLRTTPPSTTALDLSRELITTTTRRQNIVGFCQEPDPATAGLARQGAAGVAPVGHPVQFAELVSGTGFIMKRTDLGGGRLFGHLCNSFGITTNVTAVTGIPTANFTVNEDGQRCTDCVDARAPGSFAGLQGEFATNGQWQDRRGGNSAVMAFMDGTNLDCEGDVAPGATGGGTGSARIGVPSGLSFPEEQSFGFHIVCNPGSANLETFVVFTFVPTVTLSVGFPDGSLGGPVNGWDTPAWAIGPTNAPINGPVGTASNRFSPIGVLVISIMCTEPPFAPADRTPSYATSTCGDNCVGGINGWSPVDTLPGEMYAAEALSTVADGVIYRASCAACRCDTFMSSSGPVEICNRRSGVGAGADDNGDSGDDEEKMAWGSSGGAGGARGSGDDGSDTSHLDDGASQTARRRATRGAGTRNIIRGDARRRETASAKTERMLRAVETAALRSRSEGDVTEGTWMGRVGRHADDFDAADDATTDYAAARGNTSRLLWGAKLRGMGKAGTRVKARASAHVVLDETAVLYGTTADESGAAAINDFDEEEVDDDDSADAVSAVVATNDSSSRRQAVAPRLAVPRTATRVTFTVIGCDNHPDEARCCMRAFLDIRCNYDYPLESCWCRNIGEVVCPTQSNCPQSKIGFYALLGLLGIIPICLALLLLCTAAYCMCRRPKVLVPVMRPPPPPPMLVPTLTPTMSLHGSMIGSSVMM